MRLSICLLWVVVMAVPLQQLGVSAFPLNWVWWVTLIVSTFILSTLGEVLVYFLSDMREIKVEH